MKLESLEVAADSAWLTGNHEVIGEAQFFSLTSVKRLDRRAVPGSHAFISCSHLRN
jgi:hypothetical protein